MPTDRLPHNQASDRHADVVLCNSCWCRRSFATAPGHRVSGAASKLGQPVGTQLRHSAGWSTAQDTRGKAPAGHKVLTVEQRPQCHTTFTSPPRISRSALTIHASVLHSSGFSSPLVASTPRAATGSSGRSHAMKISGQHRLSVPGCDWPVPQCVHRLVCTACSAGGGERSTHAASAQGWGGAREANAALSR
jgi:hypothetical protein